LLASCSPSWQTKRAEERVIANVGSLERMGKLWSSLHPCVPDSFIQFIPGKSDTLSFLRVDTTIAHDTTIITKAIEKIKRQTDTIYISVKDQRERKILLAEIDTLNSKTSKKDIKIANLNTELVSASAKADKWFWIWIATLAIAVIIIFRKPIFYLLSKI
jgi:hypothetical protein